MKLYSLLFLTLGLLSAPLDIHSASKKKSVSKKKYTKKKVAKKVTLNDEQIAAAAAAQLASERARAEVAKRTPSKKKKGSSPAPVAKKGKKKAAPAKKTKKKSRPDASAEEQAQRERERLEQEQAEERARMEQERRDRELAQQLAQEEAHKAQEALHAAKHADAAEHARLAQEAQAAQAEVERLEQERQAAERAAEELRLKQQEELARKVDEDLERERQSIARAELKRKERERKRREQEQQEQQELARQQVQGLSEELRQQQEQQREQERANREREEARKKAQLQADAQAAAEAARRGGEEERRAATAAAREKEEQGRFLIHFRNPVGLELQVDPNPSSFASQTLESTVANVILHTIPDFIAAGNHHFTNAQGADLAGETTVGALASNPDGLVPRESKSGKRVIHVSLAAGAGEKHGAAGEAKKKKESWTLVFRNIVGREFVVNNSGGGEGGRTLNEVITSYLGFGPDFIDDGNRHFANARGDALAGNVSIDTLIGMDINKNFPQSAQGKRVINVSLAAGADGKHAAAGVGESKEAASAVSRQEQIDKEAASLRHAIDTNDEDALRALLARPEMSIEALRLGQQYADKNNKKAAELLINDVIAERMVAGLKKDVKNRTEMRSPLTILLTAQDTPYVSTLTNLQRLIDANDEEQLRAYLSDRSNTIKTTTNKATLQAALDYAQKKGSRFIPILTQAVQNKKTRLEELADALNDYPRGVEEVIRGRETPLLIAARRFDVPVVELLLSRKADVNFHDTANGQTALHEAVKDEGHEESRKDLVEVLLRYHPDVDVVNREQETPLMLASAFDRSLLVRLLLDHHASVNVQDRYGRTALIWAAEQNSLDSARLLLEHGANKDIQDKRNKRAIDYATAPAMRALLTK